MESPEPGTHTVEHECRETTMGEHGRRTLVGGLPLELEHPGLPLIARIGLEVDSDPIVKKRMGLRFVRILATMTNAIGDADLTDKPLAERVVAVGQLSVSDWHYIAMLQLAAVDAGRHSVDLDETETCPTCKAQLPRRVVVDLHEIAVYVFDEPPVVTYRFADEWTLLTQAVTEVTIGSPKLVRAVENATDIELSNGTLQEMAWVAASITHVNGRPSVVTAKSLAAKDPETGRGMSTTDWNGLKAANNAAFGGVGDKAPWMHEACGSKLWIPVGWSDVFFVPSRG